MACPMTANDAHGERRYSATASGAKTARIPADRIVAIDLIANPDRLRRLDLTILTT